MHDNQMLSVPNKERYDKDIKQVYLKNGWAMQL